MKSPLELFIGGVVTVGIITALFMPGRQTAQSVKAGGQAASNLLGTAISGH